MTPSAVIRALFEQIALAERPEIWICLRSRQDVLAEAETLDSLLAASGPSIVDEYPLFGLPFAVKDNIDVKDLPTTGACPAYAYVPDKSATAVQRLIDARALLIGKTNLDQFATGLVGTRSPYGAVRNAVDPKYVSGGSSSGSAVAVALGLASFALGTDTAGSGRVPAGMNGIVGLKPSRGLVSTAGMIPACRSLDCVSVFAPQVSDAWEVLQVIAGVDAGDVYSRSPEMMAALPNWVRVGVPAAVEFFGDARAADAYSRAMAGLSGMPGCSIESVHMTPLLGAAELLYRGPWIAERQAALGDFFEKHSSDIVPVVRKAIAAASQYSAADAFAAEYRMAGFRQSARELFEKLDVLVVPTAPIHPTLDAVQADPVGLNAQLGHYTNFVNLLDLAALAIPFTLRSDGLPFGLTLIGPAGSDQRLAAFGAAIGEYLGQEAAGSARQIMRRPLPFDEPPVELAVVGAHLDLQPLNWQLLDCGARFQMLTRTAPKYALYALRDTQPPKPGLVRLDTSGAAIEVEVWEVPQRNFGRFIRQVRPPLGIGSLELADGRWVKGFICEPVAVGRAQDISSYGGWRAYLAARASA